MIFGLFDTNLAFVGNDFALDDIKLCKGSCAVMSVSSIAPMSGFGLSRKFVYTLRGASSIQSGKLLLNTAPFENGSGCAIEFIKASSTFRMIYTNAQGAAQSSGTLGSLATDQCILKLPTSKITISSDTLTVEADIEFPDLTITNHGPIGVLFNYVQLTSIDGQNMLDWYNPIAPVTSYGAQWTVAKSLNPPVAQNSDPLDWDGSVMAVPSRQRLFN